MPIEVIVEHRLCLDIVPFPQLRKVHGLEGFLTVGSREIIVDQEQIERFETRYRFTLAHEVGHWILHRDLYPAGSITDLESYLAWQERLTGRDLDDLDFQARNLGGRILLPREPFLAAVREELTPVRPELPEGVRGRNLCRFLAERVAPRFVVATAVAETRLFGDGLCEDLGISRR